MKRFFRKFRYGEKGFTLIELLVVVAILGVLAAVAVPNVGKFIGRGKIEAKETELHNIQTGVMAMMADAATGTLTGLGIPATLVVDMSTVTATTANSSVVILSSYLTGLNGTVVNTPRISYTFAADGTVTQHSP